MSTPEQPFQRVATVTDSGRSCPYCRFAFKPGVRLVDCPACHAPHHADCWDDNRGCAVLGCSNAPRDTAAPAGWSATLPPTTPRAPLLVPREDAAVQARVPQMPSQAPPPPGGYTPPPGGYTPPPGGYAPPPPDRGRSQRGLIAGVLLATVVVIAVAVVLLLHKSPAPVSADSSRTQSSSQSTSSTVSSTTSITTTTVTTSKPVRRRTPPPRPTLADDRHAIVHVLQGYESAYSDQDLGELGALFTPEVSRHGLRAGGCSETRGKQQVLETYAEQFRSGADKYDLTNLSDAAIRVDGIHADAPLNYDITTTSGPAVGSVHFYFARVRNVWLIRRIVASC
jgi:hypothetical protein